MNRLLLALLGVFLASFAFNQKTVNYSENQLIVKFKSESDIDFKECLNTNKFNNQELDALNKAFDLKAIALTGNKKEGKTFILTFNSKHDIPQLIKFYNKSNLIEFIEPNYKGNVAGQQGLLQTIPNDNYFSRQYGLNNDGTFALSPATNNADIDMDLAWDIEQGSESIIVAVIDSGTKLDHPEFSGRILNNSAEVLNGIDDDNNGYVDDITGWDFANIDNDPTDDNGHGTNVAGIIGANSNNGIGYSGVDWNCKLIICKVTDQFGSGFYTWWTDAIYYAVDNGAKVINMSLGGSGFSNIMQDAVNYANNNGVTVIACMMNEDSNVIYYPAGYTNTIAVGSTDANDERSSPFFWDENSGSSYGQHIDVVAPGNFIYGLSHQSNANYNSYWGGTSQATPLVAGLSSLLLAQNPNRSPSDIRTILRNTAVDQVGKTLEDVLGFDIYYGYGRINAHQALLEFQVKVDEAQIDDFKPSIFPNPSTDYLFIESKVNYKEISIVNMSGVELYRQNVLPDSNLLKIDISDLPSGQYVVNILDSDDKMIAFKKVIIQ